MSALKIIGMAKTCFGAVHCLYLVNEKSCAPLLARKFQLKNNNAILIYMLFFFCGIRRRRIVFGASCQLIPLRGAK
jgi:hypothetical protein